MGGNVEGKVEGDEVYKEWKCKENKKIENKGCE